MRASTLGPQAGQNKFGLAFDTRHGLVSGMREHLRMLNAARHGSHRRLVRMTPHRRSARLTSARMEEESSRFWDCKTDMAGPNWARHEVHARLSEARAGAHTPLWLRART